MRRCVGYIELHGKRLKYYVYGNRSEGFGVEIAETYVEKTERTVFRSFEAARNLAKKMQNGSVFPANLSEILEDYRFGSETD
jgi:hypothetical protein